MLLQEGEKLHIVKRRLFQGDLRRHHVCEVEAVGDWAFRASGYVFVLDSGTNEYVRRPERRTWIMPLCDGGQIVNLIPPEVDIEEVRYGEIDGNLVVTDGKLFRMVINEFCSTR